MLVPANGQALVHTVKGHLVGGLLAPEPTMTTGQPAMPWNMFRQIVLNRVEGQERVERGRARWG